MLPFTIKPADRLIKSYYEVLGQFESLGASHEGAVRSAFQSVLSGYARRLEWTLWTEFRMNGKRGQIAVDGALLDTWKQRRGFWEAKDVHDKLEAEIRKKIEQGYPTKNIIFQAPERAILYQNNVRQGLNEDITSPKNLVELLTEFFGYREPDHEEWDAAVSDFKERIPEVAETAKKLIDQERRTNKAFRDSFEAFYDLCRQAINPNLSVAAVEDMLVQHLLTERIFRRVFHAEEFRSRNVIAAEIEKVIASLTSRHFSRESFLSDLDRFYKAIERAAGDKEDYSEKQAFLNTVYERFFQGYSPKEADTHGIVYTPQPIVDFMVRSVEDILQKEFGRSLADKGVHILDPFVGTGNFITRVMRQIAETRKSALPYKYENELHCNEVMLLPYYIASMNIEHEYLEQVGEYKPFEGICLVDTFELAEPEQSQLGFMTEENTARVKKQKAAPIFVIIGNPPYNTGQVNENDNNKNRKYPELDKKIAGTYTRESSATLRNKLSDPYVKAFRWASDRLGDEGAVAFISNDSFVDQIAFDGMRKHLVRDFHQIYLVDLGGNVRKNPKLSGTTHNVFGIQVGVTITILVKKGARRDRPCAIWYYRTGEFLKKEEKYAFLDSAESVAGIRWEPLAPDRKGTWLTGSQRDEFLDFIPTASAEQKKHQDPKDVIFGLFSLGVVTNRDRYCYGFDPQALKGRVQTFIDVYNSAIDKLTRNRRSLSVDDVADVREPRIKWTRQVKKAASNFQTSKYKENAIREALYRPFSKLWLYFDDFWNEEQYQNRRIFPAPDLENRVICAPSIGGRAPYWCLASSIVASLTLTSIDGTQCFPFYTYSEGGSNRRENITDWALAEFRRHYNDPSITKWDIFHYVYAVLHHPQYRERYAANLKRELPRIPMVGVESVGEGGEKQIPRFARDDKGSGASFGSAQDRRDDKEALRAFVEVGTRLADLHVNYEAQPEYPLQEIWKPGSRLNYRVAKMRLGRDKASLFYNDDLTLAGIPAEVFEYRLGNRSALEWVIDQYQVSTDKRSGIVNDPNREDDPQYILRLVKQVIHVSLETMKAVRSLPAMFAAGAIAKGGTT